MGNDGEVNAIMRFDNRSHCLVYAPLGGNGSFPAAKTGVGVGKECVSGSFEPVTRQKTGGASIILAKCGILFYPQASGRSQDVGRLAGLLLGAGP